MDELFAKDAAFFHDNFAGSLTKRVLSFATRFEEFVDTLDVQGRRQPRAARVRVAWCCGATSPWLVVALLGMIAVTAVGVVPLIRRRQALVDQREEAIARGVRARRRQPDEHGHGPGVRRRGALGGRRARRRVAEQRRKSILLLGLRQPAHRHGRRADVRCGPTRSACCSRSRSAAARTASRRSSVASRTSPTRRRIMFEFNQIYRRLESSITEAAQFTELLLTPPTVLGPGRAGAAAARAVRRPLRTAWASRTPAGEPLFTALDLDVPSGARIGLVGRSGGGKTTLTRLLLRMTDVAGRPDPDRRAGHQQAAAGGPARPDRLRAAGPGDVPPHAAGEHRVRPAGGDRRRDPQRGRGGARHASSSMPCPLGSTRWSASAG